MLHSSLIFSPSHVDAVSGVLLDQQPLGPYLVGHAKFYRSNIWALSQCVMGVPTVGICTQGPIQSLDTFRKISVEQPIPSVTPRVALHPGGGVLGSASDQSIQMWEIGNVTSTLIQTLRVPGSTSSGHVEFIEVSNGSLVKPQCKAQYLSHRLVSMDTSKIVTAL